MSPKSPSLLHSFGVAITGIGRACQAERNMRLHLGLAAAAAALGLWLSLTPAEWAVLALTIGFVLFAEMVNSALELIVDLASPGRHPLAGAAKDVAAGAVLVAAITAVAVALALFGPRLLGLIWR